MKYPRYLTNIDPSATLDGRAPTNHETLAFRVRAASILSGQNVGYLQCAMPDSWTHKEPSCNHYGCIVGWEGNISYSPFWRAWEAIEPKAAS